MPKKNHSESKPETLGDRVKMRRNEIGMSQGELARRVSLTQPTISSLERNESATSMSIGSIAHALGVSALWLETGLGDMLMPDQPRGLRKTYNGKGIEVFSIDLRESRGSCGGNTAGKPDIDAIRQEIAPVLKDRAFFDRLGVKPEEVFALIADGDGGANFIMHGDTVLFRTFSGDRLQSGLIYALDTPDGPRIKRVHHRSDGHLVLSCDNNDKVRYPDEEYSPAAAATLAPVGVFLYREG